ncbi:NUT family member 2F-like [Camarhynchus parvulus]|uniref:NUT family member 2F-like n=1 Tax=Geospiza parvula TaxID=87175 RepID=UPI001237C4E7|nr:NUT family member 2F-like [Camarhynchus parvulus]
MSDPAGRNGAATCPTLLGEMEPPHVRAACLSAGVRLWACGGPHTAEVFCIPPGLLNGQPEAWPSCLLSVVPAPETACQDSFSAARPLSGPCPRFICPLVPPGNKRKVAESILLEPLLSALLFAE